MSTLHRALCFDNFFTELKNMCIVSVVLVIPVSSATAERSFSTMRQIKICMRLTMTGHDFTT